MAHKSPGQHSISNQFTVALSHYGPLSGRSPWEIPWSKIVREDSFHTLDGVCTGYGENGACQGRLDGEGMSTAVTEELP